MRSLYIGTYAGIPVKLHWTFGLMIIYVLYIGSTEGLDIPQTLCFAAFLATLFFCVVLHEYGHALTARRYGVKTVDIILSPIGGLARLQRIPQKPVQELAVAIAGPAVNVVIALLLLLVLHLVYGLDAVLSDELDLGDLTNPKSFMAATLGINIILFLFNLIPAFPMDGGRILRALLGMRYDRVKATQIASIIGQVLAVGFIGIAGYYGLLSWGLIGLFVIYTARNEYRSVKQEHYLHSNTASDIMQTNFTVLHEQDTIASAIQSSERHRERNFLVKRRDTDEVLAPEILGVLASEKIEASIASNLTHQYIGDHTTTNWRPISPDTRLTDVFTLMNTEGLSLVAIMENGQQPIGVIDRYHLQKSFR